VHVQGCKCPYMHVEVLGFLDDQPAGVCQHIRVGHVMYLCVRHSFITKQKPSDRLT
jgi:hypothetical protein